MMDAGIVSETLDVSNMLIGLIEKASLHSVAVKASYLIISKKN